MDYEIKRDKILELLKEVPGIGKVFPSRRHTADWPSFLNRFAVPHPSDSSRKIICVCWFTRRPIVELDEGGTGSRDESTVLTAVEIDETWEITLLYGFQDDDTDPSENGFQNLVDAICEKFRWQDQLGGVPEIFVSAPVNVTDAYLAMWGQSEGVLCHTAIMQLKLKQRDDGS